MTRLPRICLTIPVAMTLTASVLLGGGAGAAPSRVSLGTAGAFAVLGGQAVTNTGPSVITENLGVSPGSSVTGFAPPGVVGPPGTIHTTDAVAAQAQNDVTTAYNTAAGLPCRVDLTGQNLGGLTLTPGVYCFSSSTQLTGTLTLDGQGDPEADFVFQTGSTLTTASGSAVLFTRQAQACRVFFQVGRSATLGTGSQFVGTILALTSITATTGASVQGRLLARNGAVTLDTNTVTRPSCLPAATTSSTTAPGGTSSTVASGAATTSATRATPATVTTRATIPTVTAATALGRNSAATTPTNVPAQTTSTRLATTGGQFSVLVAAALLAMVAGAMILCAPRLRVTLPGPRV